MSVFFKYIPKFLECVRLSVFFYQQLQEWLLNKFGRGRYLLFVDDQRDRLTKIQFIHPLKLKINKSEKETMGKKGQTLQEDLSWPQLNYHSFFSMDQQILFLQPLSLPPITPPPPTPNFRGATMLYKNVGPGEPRWHSRLSI